MPTGSNMPNLRKQGEFNAQGSIGLKNPSFGSSVSASYAASSALGLSAKAIVSSGWNFDVQKTAEMQHISGGGMYGEISAGHYAFQAQDLAMKEGVSLTTFGGFGLGRFTSHIMDAENKGRVMDAAQVQFSSAFIQPAAIIRHRLFDLGFSARVGYVHFNKGTFTGDNFRFRSTYQFFQNNNSFAVLEPSVQLWVNSYDNLRFTLFAAATSMPAEIATTALWGVGAQYEFGGGLPKFRQPKPVFGPYFDPHFMPFPTLAEKKFTVCKNKSQ